MKDLIKQLLAQYLAMRQDYISFRGPNPTMAWETDNGYANYMKCQSLLSRAQGAAQLLNTIAMAELADGREFVYHAIVKETQRPFSPC